jgi:23S rRNA (uracil1939-C5)-methyltransferase
MKDLDTTIEKLGLQGDGITPEGLYVSLSLPGERVRLRVSKDRGEIVDILTPSRERIKPACKHFGACGGCNLQHWAFQPYGAFKREMVQAVLNRGGVECEVDQILMTLPGTRRRVGLHARKQKGRTELGFKARRSWDMVPIEECHVADPAIVKALPALSKLASYLFEQPKSAPILNVTVTETGLDIDIRGVEQKTSGGLSMDARVNIAIHAEQSGFARVSLGDEIICQSRPPRVRFGQAVVDLPTSSFLQASPLSEGDMAGIVREAVKDARRVADLFCGCGTFTFPIAETANVYAADSTAAAIAALKTAAGRTPGLKGIEAEARDLFRRPMLASEMKGFDVIVFDPPRAGAEAQAKEIADSKVARVVGISCNPQTFARDAKILLNGGFKVDKVTPIDQFLWSNHIELVATFSR